MWLLILGLIIVAIVVSAVNNKSQKQSIESIVTLGDNKWQELCALFEDKWVIDKARSSKTYKAIANDIKQQSANVHNRAEIFISKNSLNSTNRSKHWKPNAKISNSTKKLIAHLLIICST